MNNCTSQDKPTKIIIPDKVLQTKKTDTDSIDKVEEESRKQQ